MAVVVIPEGVVEFVPEFSVLIGEINELLAGSSKARRVQRASHLG